jgi:hypothetical protein
LCLTGTWKIIAKNRLTAIVFLIPLCYIRTRSRT